VAIRAAIAALTWVFGLSPHQDDRATELLVGGVQQLGVVHLGEALSPVAAVPAGVVHAVDQPGPAPGLIAISAASETRLLLAPVTLTTGARPRRPQVRPFGGLKP